MANRMNLALDEVAQHRVQRPRPTLSGTRPQMRQLNLGRDSRYISRIWRGTGFEIFLRQEAQVSPKSGTSRNPLGGSLTAERNQSEARATIVRSKFDECFFQDQIGGAMNKIILEEAAQKSHLPFWSDRKKKIRSIFFIAAAVFILTLPYSTYSIFIYPLVDFPVGLLGIVSLVNSKVDYVEIYWQHSRLPVLLAWVFYIGIAIAIIRSNRRKLVISLYATLILLLILNVTGCQIIAPSILSEGF